LACVEVYVKYGRFEDGKIVEITDEWWNNWWIDTFLKIYLRITGEKRF
jgi:hypothetical protein